MHPDKVWLAAMWPFVRDHLPPAPASVIEIGCGEFGGHVPALTTAGYETAGIDPEAPEGPEYRQLPFEDYSAEKPVEAVVASLSLHHVADPGVALDRVRDLLAPGGTLIVIEWGWEDLDEATAQWCFRRLPPETAGHGHSAHSHSAHDHGTRSRDSNDHGAHNGGEHNGGCWLARRRAAWVESGLPWPEFSRNWATEHGLHPVATIRRELEARFATIHLSEGPYYFPELADTDESAEQAAIDAGEITPGCLRYVGRRAE